MLEVFIPVPTHLCNLYDMNRTDGDNSAHCQKVSSLKAKVTEEVMKNKKRSTFKPCLIFTPLHTFLANR